MKTLPLGIALLALTACTGQYVPDDMLQLLSTVGDCDALSAASVERVWQAFCASGGAAVPQRSVGPGELVQCFERLNWRKSAEWAAMQALRAMPPTPRSAGDAGAEGGRRRASMVKLAVLVGP